MNRSTPALLGALAALLTLSACASFDRASYDARLETLTRSLPTDWKSVGDEASRPQDWQSLFNDPLLADYLAKAEANNSNLEEAAARVRAAAAELDQSKALLRPAVSADLSATGLAGLANLQETSENYASGLTASWNPDIFGLTRARIRQTEALFRLQEANAERLRRVVLAETARAYIQVIEADLQLMLSEENLSFVAETRRVSLARFKSGDLARGDAALAELEYENAAANVVSQALAARTARRALSILTGGYGENDLKVASDLPEPARLGRLPIPAKVLASRFDVAASRAAVMAAMAGAQASAREDWPALSLAGRLRGGGNDLATVFDPDFYVASLGAALSAVLFDGGRQEARQRASEANLDVALARYRAVLQTAISNVNTTLDRVTTLSQALAALRRAADAAEEALALETIKFDLGETILLDVLTVQRRVNAVRASHIAAERRLLEAQIDTYLALGSTAAL